MNYIDGKRVMHIDTSCKLYEKRDTGIAYKIVRTNAHKGIFLSNKLKRELDRDLDVQEDYARLYAITIYFLIRESLNLFDVLVICGDEHFTYVKLYLDALFIENEEYKTKRIMSIGELREITGNKKLKSYADNFANIYRKKSPLCIQRKQRGIALNIVELNYKTIKERWEGITKIISVSGG